MTFSLMLERIGKLRYRAWLFQAGVLAVGISLVGCAGMSKTPFPVVMPAAPASATMAFCDSSTPSCSGASTFSLSSIRDLNIAVSWQNLSQGTHAQTLRIVLPDGSLYQAMEISFDVPNGSYGSATTAQSLPIVGTWITQRQLVGMWKINLSVDDHDVATSSVQLTP